MKLQEIISKIEELKNSDLRIANLGLKIERTKSRDFYKTIDELIEAVKGIDTETLYRLDLEVSKSMFLSIKVFALELEEKEIGLPIGIVRIARNVNVFDSNFMYSDDPSKYKFWANLSQTLSKKISSLTSEEKNTLKTLVNNNKEYFKLS